MLAVLLAVPLASAADRPPSAVYHVRKVCGRLPACFAGIQPALDAAARDTTGRWITVDVGTGDYREKVVLRRDRLRLLGRGAARTRLHYDAVAERAGRYDRGGWGTAGSATLTVDADEVEVRGLRIENDFNYLANDALPEGTPGKIGNSQGVAAMLDTRSDRVTFDRVALLGYQDTVFTRGHRAFVTRSTIAGNIDFIFGSGMLLIEDSVVRSRPRAAPTPPDGFDSFIAAPSTPLSRPIGIVVHRSRLTRERGVRDRSVALARPWHPTTSFPDGRYADPQAVGQVSFVDCWMDAHIHPDHWTSMPGTAPDGTKSRIFRAEDSRFAERGSRGPGASRTPVAIRWTGAPDIGEVRRVIFAGWRSTR